FLRNTASVLHFDGPYPSSERTVVKAPLRCAAGRVPRAKECEMTLIVLPLLMKSALRGKRSAVTCALKCASQCAFGPCNHSDNPTFRDIASSALTRRAAIGGGTGALAIALAGTLGACSGGPSGSGTAATDEGSS